MASCCPSQHARPAVGEWPCQVQGAADRRSNGRREGPVPQHQGLLCLESLLELSVALSSDS